MLGKGGFFVPIGQYQQDVADLLSLFANCAKPAEVIAHLKRTNNRGETLAMRMVNMVNDQWAESVDLPRILRGYIKLGHPVTAVLDLLEMSSVWGTNVFHCVSYRHDLQAYGGWMWLLLEILDHSQPKSEKTAERIYALLTQQACYASNMQIFYKPVEAFNSECGIYPMLQQAYFDVVYELACNHITHSQFKVLLEKDNKSLLPAFLKFVEEQGDDYKIRIEETGILQKPVEAPFFKEKITDIVTGTNPLKLLFGLSQ